MQFVGALWLPETAKSSSLGLKPFYGLRSTALRLQEAFTRILPARGSAPESTFPVCRASGPGDPVKTFPLRARRA